MGMNIGYEDMRSTYFPTYSTPCIGTRPSVTLPRASLLCLDARYDNTQKNNPLLSLLPEALLALRSFFTTWYVPFGLKS